MLRAISSNVLHSLLVICKGGVGVIRDLEGDRLLPSGQQCDLVALLNKLPCQVDTNEACATCIPKCFDENELSQIRQQTQPLQGTGLSQGPQAEHQEPSPSNSTFLEPPEAACVATLGFLEAALKVF